MQETPPPRTRLNLPLTPPRIGHIYNIILLNIWHVIAFLESDEGAAARDEALGLEPGTTATELAETNGFALVKKPDSTEIEEEVLAAYANFGLEGELSAMPWRPNLGMRYVRTETTAFGISRPLLDLVDSGNPTLLCLCWTSLQLSVKPTRTTTLCRAWIFVSI